MSRSPREYLQHVADECRYVTRMTTGLGRDTFFADETLKRAFVRSLEVIGEAVKHIPESARSQQPHIPWRSIARMRDQLIHVYFGIDFDIVWDVVTNKVPELLRAVEQILAAVPE